MKQWLKCYWTKGTQELCLITEVEHSHMSHAIKYQCGQSLEAQSPTSDFHWCKDPTLQTCAWYAVMGSFETLSSQRQQTSSYDLLLCPLQQHGTSGYQESVVAGFFRTQTQESRLIRLSVTDMTRHHCISRYRVQWQFALVMGDGVPCYGALEIVGLLLLLFFFTLGSIDPEG